MTESATSRSPAAKPDPITAILADLWKERRGEVLADLEVLHRSIQELVKDPHDAALRAEVTAITHRLHGALGVFHFDLVQGRLSDLEGRLGDDVEADKAMVETVRSVIRDLPT